jgi:undecaprenyl-diphosphatase
MQLDIQLLFLLNSLTGHSPVLDALIVFCASYLAYILGAAFIAFLVLTKYPWRQKVEVLAVALVSVVLARGVITELIRYLYHRPRPFSVLPVHQLLTDSAWSFPSGHATFFFALATAVCLYNIRWGRWFLIGSTLIVLARVASGVHYPSDIAIGALIGVGTAYFSALGVRWLMGKWTHQTY